jgi:hypothetical protein
MRSTAADVTSRRTGSKVRSHASVLASSAVPGMQYFNARSAEGQNYRVLVQTFAPDLSVSPLDQGGNNTGRIYFDVTGPPPTEVVYEDGEHSPMVWTRQ